MGGSGAGPVTHLMRDVYTEGLPESDGQQFHDKEQTDGADHEHWREAASVSFAWFDFRVSVFLMGARR